MSEAANEVETEGMATARTKDLELGDYATLAAQLAGNPATRDALLAAHGLDEASWSQIDDGWQAKLEAAMNADHDGVHPLIDAYSAAFARAQQKASSPSIMSLERFIEATKIFRRGGDPTQALARIGVTLPQYLEANHHWARKMAHDDASARQFQETMERGAESERSKK